MRCAGRGAKEQSKGQKKRNQKEQREKTKAGGAPLDQGLARLLFIDGG